MAKPKVIERVKEFTFGAFPYDLTVVVTTDLYESIKRRAEKHSLAEPDSHDMKACVYGGPTLGWAIMFLPANANMEQIVHECFHVVWFLLHYVEVPLENELVAYHVGYLSQEVAGFTWSLPKKPRKLKK